MSNEQARTFPFGSVSKYFLSKNLKKDIPASVVVFLVALPLCLGIALASGAPLFAGILTGVVGGIVVSTISGSQLSVSGPAAGLTVIVFNAIAQLGSYEVFLLAVVLAGIIQIILGCVKAGTIGNYFPSSVITGMLAAIGIILILKQFPHAVGYDSDFEGDESFLEAVSGENTFSAVLHALERFNPVAVIIGLLSIFTMLLWPKLKKVSMVPAPLVVVVLGTVLGQVFSAEGFTLDPEHFVQVPIIGSWAELGTLLQTPDFSAIGRKEVWVVAFTIGIVASLETLLSLEAIDKIDPIKRISPTNRELVAQGVGNITSGLLGGLPMTSVIVRSSANVNAGGRTSMSAIIHGFLLLLSLLFIPFLINKIPLACLAAILIITGYKLANWSLFAKMWKLGLDQFIPFVVTIVAVVFTDLLTGVAMGMVVGVFYILRTNLRNPYFYSLETNGDQKVIRIVLSEEVSFLNKAAIQYTLTNLPADSKVIIDGSKSRFIDLDVLEIIHNFEKNAFTKRIAVELQSIQTKYDVPKLQSLIYQPKK